MTRRSRPTQLLFFAVFALWVGRVHAATVMIFKPSSNSAAIAEALYRIQGELLAVGLEVELAPRPPSRTKSDGSEAAFARRAHERGVIATIEVAGKGTSISVEIVILERGPQRLEVSRVVLDTEAASGSDTLAIRAIEVLRSRFLELDLGKRERRAEERQPKPSLPRAPSAKASRFGLAAGASILTGVDGVGPALLPLVRFDWRAERRLVFQATWSGFGTHPTLESAGERAELAQHYAVIGLCYCPEAYSGLRPIIGLSAGVLRTSLDGKAKLPNHGHLVERWSFLLDAGLGARLQWSGRYFVTLASHVQLAEPNVAVYFVDKLVGTTGRPNFAFPLTVGAWL